MRPLSSNGLNKVSIPQIGRRKKPIRHGVYVNGKNALKIRKGAVTYLVRRAVDAMPWLRDEHISAVRKWAEIEVIRRAAFAGLVRDGVLRTDAETGDVMVRRLVHDHRQLALAQLTIEQALLMTPAAAAQLTGQQSGLDLVAAMATAPTETVEEAEKEPDDDGKMSS